MWEFYELEFCRGGGSFPGGSLMGGNFPGGNYPGENFPRTNMNMYMYIPYKTSDFYNAY